MVFVLYIVGLACALFALVSMIKDIFRYGDPLSKGPKK